MGLRIYDASAGSVEERDRRLLRVSEDLWGGRDIPSLVTLDGGGPVDVTGRRAVRRSPMAASGIAHFPTVSSSVGTGSFAGRSPPGRSSR
jgi:hypothetical protein